MIVRTIHVLRRATERLRAGKADVALAPTMGSLHDGHMSLVRLAKTAREQGHRFALREADSICAIGEFRILPRTNRYPPRIKSGPGFYWKTR
jgi:hypothetical protein